LKKIAVYLYNHPVLLIALFTAVAYLPVLLPFFYVKNDLVTQMLPMRFFVSESLHDGHMPWWNPFVNFGIPQYGDMNGAFWNPIVWLISITAGYNIWTITIELVFYIFLSGWGTYLLLKNLNVQKSIALMGSFAFLASGYMIGHLQHSSWITGAAFFPFVLLYFIRINERQQLKDFLYGALSLYMLLSSTHPGIVIGGIYFILFWIAGSYFIKGSALSKSLHPSFIKNNLFFLVISILVCAGIIAGYSDIIPYMTRGEQVNVSENATTLQSFISLLFPLAVHKSAIFQTDISMRNVHIGIAILAGFIVFFRVADKKTVYATLFVFLFFLLLSAGGIFTSFANSYIPGAGYVRLTGEFSLFTVFIMVIAGAYGLNLYNQKKKNDSATLLLLKWLLYFFSLSLLISIVSIFLSRHSIIYQFSRPEQAGMGGFIKSILDGITITDLFLVQSCISLFFLFLLRKLYNRQSYYKYLLIAAHLIIVTWLCLPFTGLGSKSKKEISSILLSAPKGIPIQPVKIANQALYIDSANFEIAGLPNVWSKQIYMPWDKEYPVNLKINAALFTDTAKTRFIQRQAYLFFSKDTSFTTETNFDSSHIKVLQSSPGFIEVEINNEAYNYFTFTQNNYTYWKSYINDKPTPHFSGFNSFLTVHIPKGKSIVKFEFYPRPIIIAALISFVLLVIMIVTLLFLEYKSFTRNAKRTN